MKGKNAAARQKPQTDPLKSAVNIWEAFIAVPPTTSASNATKQTKIPTTAPEMNKTMKEGW